MHKEVVNDDVVLKCDEVLSNLSFCINERVPSHEKQDCAYDPQ